MHRVLHLLHIRIQNVFQQSGDVLKMIVKGIAADTAAVHDVFYSDLIQRPFVQQPDKGFFNSLACKVCRGFLQPDDPYTLS